MRNGNDGASVRISPEAWERALEAIGEFGHPGPGGFEEQARLLVEEMVNQYVSDVFSGGRRGIPSDDGQAAKSHAYSAGKWIEDERPRDYPLIDVGSLFDWLRGGE